MGKIATGFYLSILYFNEKKKEKKKTKRKTIYNVNKNSDIIYILSIINLVEILKE